MIEPSVIRQVALAICISRTCEGYSCCQWPSQMARRHDCPVNRGNYDDAALAAINATIDQIEIMMSLSPDLENSACEVEKNGA